MSHVFQYFFFAFSNLDSRRCCFVIISIFMNIVIVNDSCLCLIRLSSRVFFPRSVCRRFIVINSFIFFFITKTEGLCCVIIIIIRGGIFGDWCFQSFQNSSFNYNTRAHSFQPRIYPLTLSVINFNIQTFKTSIVLIASRNYRNLNRKDLFLLLLFYTLGDTHFFSFSFRT